MNSANLNLFALALAVLLLSAANGAGAQEAAPDTAPPDVSADEAVLDYESEDFDETWVEPLSQRERDEAELTRAFYLYKEAVTNASYDEADTLAKQIVELSISLYGIDSHESAKALTNLALVQHKNQDHESAQLNFQSSIDIIERIEDRLHAGLVNPLKGLGAAQLASGRPDMARQTFDRAVHTTHVNEGPHNLDQVEVLDALTEIYLSVGELDEALDLQENVYTLHAREVGPKSEEILPALEHHARWMHRMRLYNRERNAYRKMIKIIEVNRGKGDLGLIAPLTGLGKSYLYIGSLDVDLHSETGPISSGEIYLKRALRIVEKNPDADWKLLEGSMLALGDFYTLSSRPSRAKRVYQETWAMLSEDEERYRSRHEQLETLVQLQGINPPRYHNSQRDDSDDAPPETFERGTVVAAYTVTARGEVSGVSIIESEPPGFDEMEKALLREMRYLMHRPRIESGTLVTTPDQRYVHEFFYRESDLAEEALEAELAQE